MNEETDLNEALASLQGAAQAGSTANQEERDALLAICGLLVGKVGALEKQLQDLTGKVASENGSAVLQRHLEDGDPHGQYALR